jgi:hypothetical protein
MAWSVRMGDTKRSVSADGGMTDSDRESALMGGAGRADLCSSDIVVPA